MLSELSTVVFILLELMVKWSLFRCVRCSLIFCLSDNLLSFRVPVTEFTVFIAEEIRGVAFRKCHLDVKKQSIFTLNLSAAKVSSVLLRRNKVIRMQN